MTMDGCLPFSIGKCGRVTGLAWEKSLGKTDGFCQMTVHAANVYKSTHFCITLSSVLDSKGDIC